MKVIGKAEVEDTSQLTEFTLAGDSGSSQIIRHGDTLTLEGGNAISTVASATDTVVINHEDTSSQASVNNSGRTYIQDITLDTYGHVTALTSATETVTNTDTDSLFNISTVDHEESDREVIRLSATNNSDHAATNVNLAVGTGLSIANDADSNTITITNTVSDTNTQLSNAQVRSAVEAATDSNVFTDADHTKLNGIEASADVTDTSNVTAAGALMDSELTDLAGVKGMTVANKANVASPTFTGTPAAPTASSSTNTTQIATTAFVKAQYSYQYLTFSFKTTSYISNTFVTPSQNGPEYYLWNNSHGADGLEPASHSPAEMIINEGEDSEYYIEIDYLDQPSAFVIPKACKLDGFYGNCRTNNTSPSSARPVMGLFRASEPADSNTNDVIAACVAIDKYDTSTGNRKNRFLKLENQGLDTNLAQGDLLFPAVGLDADMDDSSGMIWGSFTIVLKTLIP